jgi:hypothetical protein
MMKNKDYRDILGGSPARAKSVAAINRSGNGDTTMFSPSAQRGQPVWCLSEGFAWG